MAKYIVEKLKTFKFPLMVVTIATLILDLVAFVLLVAFQYEFKYIICPMLAFVIDILFVLAVFNTNYRFKYSLTSSIFYILTTIVLSIIPFLTINVFGTTAIFTTIAGLLLILMHLLLVIGTGLSLKAASKPIEKAPKKSVFAFSAILVVMCVAIISYIATNGYFGQGNNSRTIVYEYNSNNKTYSVVNVLGGRGDTLVVPESFNGYEVNEIDLSLFARDDIKNVIINTNNFKLTNNKKIDEVNPNLVVSVNSKQYDYFKEVFYNIGTDKSVKLANNSKPVVEDDVVYVSFAYSKEELEKLNYKILPTWFGKKGDIFDMNYYRDFEYTKHMNSNSTDDLYWCYNNLNSSMLKPLINENKDIRGEKVNNSIDSLDISLHDIYKVSILDDNDLKYEIADEDKYSKLSSGQYLLYSLSIYDDLDEIYEKISNRQGFSLKLRYGTNTYTSIKEACDENNKNQISLHPEWKLNAPNITEMHINDEAIDLNDTVEFTYGDNMKIHPTVEASVSGISFRYSWSKSSASLSTNATYEESLRKVGDNQIYVLSVEAYSNTITSLTSKSVANIKVDVNKKDLDFTWLLHDDGTVVDFKNLTYDGKDKVISVSHSGVIAGDTISYNLTNNYVNAGSSIVCNNVCSNNIKIVLSGETANCYKISNTSISSRNFSVLPRNITVKVDSKTSIYGEELVPLTTNITQGSLASGDNMADVFAVEYKPGLNKYSNAGSYDVVTSTNNYNYNVTFENASKAYKITARSITVSIDSKSGIYGDALETFTSNVTEGTVVNNDVAYTLASNVTSKSNIGNYPITGVNSNPNYDVTFNSDAQYTINVRPITISIDNKSSVYGDALAPFTSKVTEGTVISGDTAYQLTSTVESKSNIGGYTITVGYSNPNYYVTYSDAEYTINARPIIISINNQSSEYGDDLATLTASVTGKGLVDDPADVYVLSFKDNINKFSACGDYEVLGELNNSNYEAEINPGTYTIKKRNITVSATKVSSVYGDELSSLAYRITSGNLVNNHSLSDVVSVSYEDGLNKYSNAGLYDSVGTTLNNNYNVTFKGFDNSYEVKRRPITVTIDNKSSVYGAPLVELTSRVTKGTIVNNDSVYTINTTATSTSNAATYKIYGETINTNSNYSVTFNSGTYTIKARDLTNVVATGVNCTYDGQAHKITVSAVALNEEVNIVYSREENGTYTTEELKFVDAGEYKVYYQISAPNHNTVKGYKVISIAQKTINVNWNKTTFNDTDAVKKPTATNLSGISIEYKFYELNTNEPLAEAPTEAGSYKCIIVCKDNNYVLTNNTCVYEILDSEVL